MTIPSEALDDRLAFVGTTGSGKTYTASAAVERLLSRGARCVIVDPLDVWWGLRLMADGKTPSPHKVVIFGGAHGDLPLNEHAGALLGETAASIAESCVISLGGLQTKAAERRFMLAFLDAIYRKTDPRKSDPYHIVFDEADLWAPQKSSEPMLQSRMEEIVRRGRVRGFIPWLITQRPAVLSKDVLSQADGLVAMKLTSSQDRDAIGAWVEGQADKTQWKATYAQLATMQQGQGVVWLPGRGILETQQFPKKQTFDSSRTPKRGEKRTGTELKPIDLGALRDKLASVEAETKANDPKELKAQLAKLQREMAAAVARGVAADPAELAAAEQRGYERGFAEGQTSGRDVVLSTFRAALETAQGAPVAALPVARAAPAQPSRPAPVAVAPRAPRPATQPSGLDGPLQRILDAIRWWNVLGVAAPSHPQAAFIAGYSHKSGTWATYLSRLRSMQLIEGRGDLALTPAGESAANEPSQPPTGAALRSTVLGKLDGPLTRILSPIMEAYPRGLSHTDAAERAGYSHQSGTWATYLSRLRSLDLIDGRGELRAQDWLFPSQRMAA